ncbi:Uncharacterised protein [Mycobacteroides abscessus subsp. abscessus]|nr:Uncharacterised protein [Mycobacteroides abscessus subsp. abscessus]
MTPWVCAKWRKRCAVKLLATTTESKSYESPSPVACSLTCANICLTASGGMPFVRLR